jgi:hypothetical protein
MRVTHSRLSTNAKRSSSSSMAHAQRRTRRSISLACHSQVVLGNFRSEVMLTVFGYR